MTYRRQHWKPNNPHGMPRNLRKGNPRPGVPLAPQRIRMPSEEDAAALRRLLESVPRMRRAETLGRLITAGLKARQEGKK